MLQARIELKQQELYATYIYSRYGNDKLKTHKTLGAAKQAISYHHCPASRSAFVANHPNKYTNGLYRWNNGGWDLIFVAHPGLTKREVSTLMKYIK